MSPNPSAISVLIPNHGMNHHLVALINNIASQISVGLGDEVIVFFDGTQIDESLQQFLARYPFVKTMVSEDRVGVSIGRNQMAQAARNSILRFQDADDLLAPYALATARAILPQLKQWHMLVGGQLVYKDRMFNRVVMHPPRTKLSDLLLKTNPILVNMSFFNRESFLQTQGFDPKLEFEQDWDLWLQYLRLWGDDAFTLCQQLFGVYNVFSQERANKTYDKMINGVPHRQYMFEKNGYEMDASLFD